MNSIIYINISKELNNAKEEITEMLKTVANTQNAIERKPSSINIFQTDDFNGIVLSHLYSHT